MNKRKIAIFTGNRAEYGLQLPLLQAVHEHPLLEEQLIVAGAHLSTQYGQTLNEVKKDGFNIAAKVPIELKGTDRSATARAIGEGIVALTETFEKLAPDFVVVYADRFEGFAAITAASQMNIPTAHIEGGDLTEGGALDDSVRHAMTKLSHLHFATNAQAANRILAMGEEAWRVHNTGFPAIDLISEKRYAQQQEVEEKLKIDTSKALILFTQHSVSTEFDRAEEQITPSLNALKKLAKQGIQVLITYPNNDAGGATIIESLKTLDTQNLENISISPSLGRHLYHGVLALALDPNCRIACAGNSSSGLKETPAFCCPTVNIGSRQQGRLKGANVIDCDYNEKNILTALKKALFDADFKSLCRNSPNPYYLGGAGKKIAEVLASVYINTKLLQKSMTLKGEYKDGWFQ